MVQMKDGIADLILGRRSNRVIDMSHLVLEWRERKTRTDPLPDGARIKQILAFLPFRENENPDKMYG